MQRNPTPTWLRFQQLDSASGETATSSNLGRPTRIQFLQIPSRLQDFQRFLKKPQCSSNQQFQSSPATSTVDAIPHSTPFEAEWKFYSKNFKDSQTSSSIQKKYQRNSTPKAWTTRVTFRVQTFLFQKGRCCDMGQNDTIHKIELNPSIVLSSENTNCKNDIQLFHQLFDELSVYRDYH